LPDSSQIISGSYKPSDWFDGTDNFPAPAPAGPYDPNLSTFDGTSPNGTWSLYVLDDSAVARGGAISGGWQIRFQTTPKISGLTTPQTTLEDTLLRVTFSIGDNQPGVAGISVTATSDNQTLVPNANMQIDGTGSSRTLSILPALNQFGTNNIT